METHYTIYAIVMTLSILAIIVGRVRLGVISGKGVKKTLLRGLLFMFLFLIVAGIVLKAMNLGTDDRSEMIIDWGIFLGMVLPVGIITAVGLLKEKGSTEEERKKRAILHKERSRQFAIDLANSTVNLLITVTVGAAFLLLTWLSINQSDHHHRWVVFFLYLIGGAMLLWAYRIFKKKEITLFEETYMQQTLLIGVPAYAVMLILLLVFWIGGWRVSNFFVGVFVFIVAIVGVTAGAYLIGAGIKSILRVIKLHNDDRLGDILRGAVYALLGLMLLLKTIICAWDACTPAALLALFGLAAFIFPDMTSEFEAIIKGNSDLRVKTTDKVGDTKWIDGQQHRLNSNREWEPTNISI